MEKTESPNCLPPSSWATRWYSGLDCRWRSSAARLCRRWLSGHQAHAPPWVPERLWHRPDRRPLEPESWAAELDEQDAHTAVRSRRCSTCCLHDSRHRCSIPGHIHWHSLKEPGTLLAYKYRDTLEQTGDRRNWPHRWRTVGPPGNCSPRTDSRRCTACTLAGTWRPHGERRMDSGAPGTPHRRYRTDFVQFRCPACWVPLQERGLRVSQEGIFSETLHSQEPVQT